MTLKFAQYSALTNAVKQASATTKALKDSFKLQGGKQRPNVNKRIKPTENKR